MDTAYDNWLKNRTIELKSLRSDLVDKLKNRGHAIQDGPSSGIGRNQYSACVWIDLKDTPARIAFFEDADIDPRTCNFHPGRYGYVTFFKNLSPFGHSCASSNTKVPHKNQIIYNLDNRECPNIRADKNHIDEIIEKFEEFLAKES